MESRKHLKEEEFLPLLIEGDMKSFEAIYAAYSRKLYQMAYSQIGNKEDSEEIIQEVFIKLWESRQSLGHVQSLYPYLYTMVKNEVFRYYRSNLVRDKYVEAFRKVIRDFDNSIEEQLNLSDTQATIEKSLSTLPENVQTAFKLSRNEHLPIKQIAKEMDLAPGTVENYITMACNHLRVKLGKMVIIAVLFLC